MGVLELAYLHEVGRARDSVETMLEALRRSIGLAVADLSSAALVGAATGLSWTRDPFDRLIAAHAIVADAPLITADRTILEHLPQAIWD
jgi:PIN domain nuclease of toxin-antitoxin system